MCGNNESDGRPRKNTKQRLIMLIQSSYSPKIFLVQELTSSSCGFLTHKAIGLQEKLLAMHAKNLSFLRFFMLLVAIYACRKSIFHSFILEIFFVQLLAGYICYLSFTLEIFR